MSFKLRTIGKVILKKNEDGKQNVQIVVSKKYVKCMNKINIFSHVHIFYEGKNNIENMNENFLIKDIVKIINVDNKTGVIDAEYIYDINDDSKSYHNNLINVELALFDIKPYMPSEDSVDTNMLCNANDSISLKRDIDNNTDTDIFLIDNQGLIRNVNAEIYLEFDINFFNIKDVSGSYLKVYWWFNKFDSDKFREALECNPPYENAPRSGIFLTRSPVRPNPIAFSIVKVDRYDYENNRIYINSLEAFDKTPCLGIEEYDYHKDLVKDAKVPTYLSHWPRWFDSSKQYNNLEDINYKNSELNDILKRCDIEDKNEDNKDNKDNKNINKTFENDEYNSNKTNYIPSNCIYVKGAITNNLKNIDVKVPYNKITAVVGVSGSGKSSLVNDTIYAECKRKLEYMTHNRNMLSKPEVSFISGSIPALAIQQSAIRGNSMSTVGTYTNSYDYIRLIYATIGTRHCNSCGNEIIPLTVERVFKIINYLKVKVVYNLQKDKVELKIINSLFDDKDKEKYEYNREIIQNVLKENEGALYVKSDDKFILLQTTHKCYHCNKLLLDISPSTFSYLDSESRCPFCNGLGYTFEVDDNKIIANEEKSILDGATSFYGKLRNFQINPNANWMKGQVFGLADFLHEDLEKSWIDLSDEYKNALLNGYDKEVTFTYSNNKNGRKGIITRKVEGIKEIILRLKSENNESKIFEKYLSKVICPTCNGERLNKDGRMITIGNIRYPQAAMLSFNEIIDFCNELKDTITKYNYERVKIAIDSLIEISNAAISLGIEYIKLNQGTQDLSNGEAQRLKLLSAYINHLSGILYVLDEPSKGLSPRDYDKVIKMIKKLIDEKNTVLMVEHNEDMIKCADYLIEIGPGAGSNGGEVIAQGNFKDVINNKQTQIGKYLSESNTRLERNYSRDDSHMINMSGLNKLYLKNIDVSFPVNALTCICGVSGSGKSTLLKKEIYPRMSMDKKFSKVVLVDQVAIGKNSKSIVATYTGILDIIRELLADSEYAISQKYDSSYFSFNSANGKCTTCNGDGRIAVKYLEDTFVKCSECNGIRYKKEILNATYNEKNINEILNLSVDEAKEFFKDNKDLSKILYILDEVGLGYLKLGQSTSTLSGGETQRLKLSCELMSSKKSNTLYLLDEPTTGLHFADVENLIKLIIKLISEKNTVVAIEHNKQFIENADYIIELGPGACEDGGQVIKSEWKEN